MPCFVHVYTKTGPACKYQNSTCLNKTQNDFAFFVQYTWMTGEKIHSLGEIMHNIKH